MTSLSINSRAGSHRAVLAICAVAQVVVVLDVSIVNVALPQMRHDLGLTLTSQQWVVNAYTLTFAGFLMLGGRAADLFGPSPASSGGSPNRALRRANVAPAVQFARAVTALVTPP